MHKLRKILKDSVVRKFVATIVLGIVSIGLLLLAFYRIHFFFENIANIIFGIITYSLVASCFLYFFHKWSISTSNILREAIKESEEYKEQKDGLLCEYCGHKPAIIVCSACDSIQWFRPPLEKFLYALAVFSAHHRWRILAAYLSIFLITPIGFAFVKGYEITRAELNRAQGYEDDARKVLEYLALVRSAIHELEALADMGEKESPRPELFNTMMQNYYRFSWFAPRVLAHYQTTECGKSLDDSARQRRRESACKIVSEGSKDHSAVFEDSSKYNLLIRLDRRFLDYVQAFSKSYFYRTDTLAIDSVRKSLAGLFYKDGKTVGCAIGELAFGSLLDDGAGVIYPSCGEQIEFSTDYHQSVDIRAPLPWEHDWPNIPNAASKDQ